MEIQLAKCVNVCRPLKLFGAGEDVSANFDKNGRNSCPWLPIPDRVYGGAHAHGAFVTCVHLAFSHLSTLSGCKTLDVVACDRNNNVA